ncbi:M48 family metallopeptidase [Desulforhopalus singaporensis]|uniref:Peptidase family M48 n=1 Tax=Desulforhopalus singaporensis TaxID=91360 RepID=A0A1H0M0U4_9BACT|nr:M48 family metallopeptidase [Desulforhopalus singaporensis]SDO74102.1 Peptidase family M48 [Desulforhopalus singaporensis]
MNAQTVRCQNDLEIFNRLLHHPDVRRVNEFLESREDGNYTGVRRRLLSSSVRLSREMAWEVHKVADECIGLLEGKTPLELYVFPSPQFNAMCFKPEDGRLFIMFSSSLLESFSMDELRFVMGHELGHHIYRHHDIPIGHLLQGGTAPEPRLVLELFAWSRYAEISADRAGALCAGDFDTVAMALFKLASGLSGKMIRFDLDDFLKQVEDMQLEDSEPGRYGPKEDWFATHPFSPLRVKALQLYHDSLYVRENGMSRDELEVSVQDLMELMEPNYIEGRTEASIHMRRLLWAGAIAVADASDGIGSDEIAIFEKFFGVGEFSKNLDIERVKQTLDERAANARNYSSIPQRMQVLRDLCLVAKASGTVSAAERGILEKIAGLIAIPTDFIDQFLALRVIPD